MNSCCFPLTSHIIILGGDFSALPNDDILAMGLQVEFAVPTHMGHSLDRLYSSQPLFQACSALQSAIKTKHATVMTTSAAGTQYPVSNDREVFSHRVRTPRNFSALRGYLSEQTWNFITDNPTAANAFDCFYSFITDALNKFIPVRRVTIKRRDPPHVSPTLSTC